MLSLALVLTLDTEMLGKRCSGVLLILLFADKKEQDKKSLLPHLEITCFLVLLVSEKNTVVGRELRVEKHNGKKYGATNTGFPILTTSNDS